MAENNWRGLNFFQALDGSIQLELERTGNRRRFQDGVLVHSQGEVSRSMGIVESGELVLSNVSADGRRIVTARMHAGDSFGEFTLFSAAPRFCDMQASGATQILYISPRQFADCMDRMPALRDAALEMLATRLQSALNWIKDEFELPLARRLAMHLLHRAQDDAGRRRFTGTQTELAEDFGISRVAVGQALKQLGELGLIRTEYGAIELLAPDKLADWAAGDVTSG